MTTAIDLLIERHDAVLNFLRESNETSMALDFEDSYKKLLVLTCSSLFESLLINSIYDFAKNSSDDARIAELVRNKALSRQYHTFFDWDKTNVNKFLGVFGEGYKQDVVENLNINESLMQGMRDFLQIGALRNRLVHGNLVEASPDLTVLEIKEKFYSAWVFLEYLSGTLEKN
jgi:hypothetical protein